MYLPDMRRDRFEALVRQAVDELPSAFTDRLENLVITVEGWPSDEQLDAAGLDDEETLLGLYEGIPLTDREGYNLVLPDKITIFQGPIEMACETEDEVVEQVRETVVHEVAHYFGISDEELDDWGVG